jgi:DNA primase
MSLEQMAASYETTLHEAGWEAAAYLKARGIDKDAAKSYRLGLVNNAWPDHAQYAGMLCIPYITTLGGVVSLKFRRPHTCGEQCQHAKYISPYDTRLYNAVALDKADQLGYICVCEGEFDAIILDHAGFPAVGIPGVECWSAHPEWAGLFTGHQRVFVFCDPDEPGERLGKAIVRSVGSAVRCVSLGADVNDYFSNECGGDRNEFRERICEWLGVQAG